MQVTLTLLTCVGWAALANAHGYFLSPLGRQPGTAFQDSCGQQAYYNMAGDINGNIQGLEQVVATQSDYNAAECHLWKCKGLKYADNTANIQTYTPGQSVDMYFHIQAPHTGYANVSIIDISTDDGTIIASDLAKWTTYASTAVPIVTTQENFTVTMPTTLGSKCAAKGKCAIQMHWNAPDINQTYQSCVDFTMSAASSKRDDERVHARDFAPKDVEVLEA